MTIRIAFCIVTMFFIAANSSCRKKKHDTPAPVPADSVITYDNYTVLTPGNYWIYEEYQLDSATAPGSPLHVYDSCYVEKDTVISGHNYHKYHEGNALFSEEAIYFLRDSLSYTVEHTGRIRFSSRDFTSVFRTVVRLPNSGSPDTLTATERMGDRDFVTVVDAGSFITSSFKVIWHFPVGYPFGAERVYNYRYAKNVGMVSGTIGFYLSSPRVYERRLVRYHVH